LIVTGAVIAGYGDVSFDLTGYLFACGSVIAHGAYLVYLSKSRVDSGMEVFGLLFYTSALSWPVVVGVTILDGELMHTLTHYDFVNNLELTYSFLITIICGILLNFSIFFCTLVNGPLTTSVLGHVKSLVQTSLGFVLLGGVQITPFLILGCFLNTVGSYWYAYLKYKHHQTREVEQEQEKKRAEEQTEMSK